MDSSIAAWQKLADTPLWPSPVGTCQYCHEGFDFGADRTLYRGCDCLHALTALRVSHAGSYNVADSTSIQHELQEKVRRCRGKQGLIFTSAGRLSPGVKGNALLHCMHPCCICMPWSPKVCLVALHALESKVMPCCTACPGVKGNVLHCMLHAAFA